MLNPYGGVRPENRPEETSTVFEFPDDVTTNEFANHPSAGDSRRFRAPKWGWSVDEVFDRYRFMFDLWVDGDQVPRVPRGFSRLGPSRYWSAVRRPGTRASRLRCTSRRGLCDDRLAAHVLNERPRQTQLDFLALGPSGVVAVEAKFTEQGFSSCTCDGRSEGICSERVFERPYWEEAKRNLGLRRRRSDCGLSLAYQPVRNIAAAAAIAGTERSAAFVLFYDKRNPYFGGSGAWKGWVSVLSFLNRRAAVPFAAVSWQESSLYRKLPVAVTVKMLIGPGDEVGPVAPEELHHLDHAQDAVLREGARDDRLREPVRHM